MKVAIIGYGKMGKEVEKILSERGHVISKIIDIETHDMDLGNSDVAIIFSTPKTSVTNFIDGTKILFTKRCISLVIFLIR